MKHSIEITMPESWADITLRQYLDLSKELENYKDDEEAQTAILLYKLCGIEPGLLNNISRESYNVLKNDLAKFMNITEMPLQRKILVNGIEYGFEPNLSKIAYGAYADISKYDTIQIDDNWAKIMSILYRPIDKTNTSYYSVKSYDGKIDDELFLNVPMDIHFGCLFFFVNLSTDLLVSTLNSLKETGEEETPVTFNTILAKSGELTQLLLNLQMGILPKSMK
jgi:hypothetical protein